jgi:hypothetical protein
MHFVCLSRGQQSHPDVCYSACNSPSLQVTQRDCNYARFHGGTPGGGQRNFRNLTASAQGFVMCLHARSTAYLNKSAGYPNMVYVNDGGNPLCEKRPETC